MSTFIANTSNFPSGSEFTFHSHPDAPWWALYSSVSMVSKLFTCSLLSAAWIRFSIFYCSLIFIIFFPLWVNRVCDSSIQYLIFSHFSNTQISTRLPLGIFHRDWGGWWLTAEQSEKASKKKAIRKRTEQEKNYDWITIASGCSGGHTKNWNSKSRIVGRIILCPFWCCMPWIDQILISISFQFTSFVTYMLEPHYSSFRIGFSVSLQAPPYLIIYTTECVRVRCSLVVIWTLAEWLRRKMETNSFLHFP